MLQRESDHFETSLFELPIQTKTIRNDETSEKQTVIDETNTAYYNPSNIQKRRIYYTYQSRANLHPKEIVHLCY